MNDFETIPAHPLPEKPEGEPEKKEEKKPEIKMEDWGTEPPAPEPEFFKAGDDATRISEHPLPVEPKPVEEEKPVEPVVIEDAQSARTVAFEKIPLGTESMEAATAIEVKAARQPDISQQEPVEPVYHMPGKSKPEEPEVLDMPVYKPAGGGEPPKKSNTWWIVLIVVLLLLCLCCVVLVVLGLFTYSSDSYTLLPGSFTWPI